jgi:chemotaxis protein MotB
MSKPSKNNLLEKYTQASHSTTETWMTSFCDLMVNLLVFFVLIISASQVSNLKFDRIKSNLSGTSKTDQVSLVVDSLANEIDQSQLGGAVTIENVGNTIQLSFNDSLLFDLGKADVKAEGIAVLEKFSESLSHLPKTARIAIEGYTDDNPVNTRAYKSNWHLSALRSLSVLQILENREICRENCEIRGFGEYRPAVPNRDEAGRAIAVNQSENRRVVLRIF